MPSAQSQSFILCQLPILLLTVNGWSSEKWKWRHSLPVWAPSEGRGEQKQIESLFWTN